VEFKTELRRRNWRGMETYPKPTNIAVVKEIYVNAMMVEKEETISYTNYVRGKIVPYDATTINSFLGINEGNNPCEYVNFINTYCDYEEIERVVSLPGGTFVRDRQKIPLHIKRMDLNPLARVWEHSSNQISLPPLMCQISLK